MGRACSKLKTTTIDNGYLNPRGIYNNDVDYDLTIVKQLIRKGQLAPFYEGLSEPCKSKDELIYDIECPICFLYYPSRLNRTRCCDKSICTECFLQLKRSSSAPLIPAVCPFCVQPNLGVLYIPPIWSKHYPAFKSKRSDLSNNMDRRHWVIEPNDPDVVLVDRVRPRWEDMLEERRTSSAGTTRRTRVHLNHMENEHQFMQLSDQQSMNDTMAGMDLEDILVMEAIRLSLLTASNNNNDIR